MSGLSGYPELDQQLADPSLTVSRLQQMQLAPSATAAQEAKNNAETQLAPIELQEAQEKSRLISMDVADQTIAHIAKDVAAADPADRPKVWDEGMKGALARGISTAGQYIGHYNPDLAERVGDVYGGSEVSGRSRSSQQSMTAPSPAEQEQIVRAVAGMPMPQVQASLGNMNKAITSFNNVRTADDLENEVKMLSQAGIPVASLLPGLDFSQKDPAAYAQNYAAVAAALKKLQPYRDAMAARAGVTAMGGIPAAPLPLGTTSYIGTEPGTQRPVGFNPTTGAETVGPTPVGPKPSAGMSTFLLKQQAWLSAHPQDIQGALEFANGKRAMDPAQMEQAAIAEAGKLYYDETSVGGATIANPDEWVKDKAAEIFQSLSGASGGAPGAAGGAPWRSPSRSAPSPQIPARALQVLKQAGGRPVPFNNGTVWRMGPNGQPIQVR